MDSSSDDELAYLKPRLNFFKNPNAPIIDVQTTDMGSCKTDKENGSPITRAQQACMANVNDNGNSPLPRKRRKRKKKLLVHDLVNNAKESRNSSDWGGDSVNRTFSEKSSSSSKAESQEKNGSTSLNVDSFESKWSKNIQAGNSEQSGDHLSRMEGQGNPVVSPKRSSNNITRTETLQIQVDSSKQSGDLLSQTDHQEDQVVGLKSSWNGVSTEVQQIQANSSKPSGDLLSWTDHQEDQVVGLKSSWNGVSTEVQQIQADSSKQSGDLLSQTDHQEDQVVGLKSSWNGVSTEVQQIQAGSSKQSGDLLSQTNHQEDKVVGLKSSWNGVSTEVQQIQADSSKQSGDLLSRTVSHGNHVFSLKNSFDNVSRLETMCIQAECQTTITGDVFALNFYQENESVGTLPTNHVGQIVTLNDIEMYLAAVLGNFTFPLRSEETVDCGIQTDNTQECAVLPATANIYSDCWKGESSRGEIKSLDQSLCTKCLAVEAHADQTAQTWTTVVENVDKSTDMEGFHPKLYSGGNAETVKKVVDWSLQTDYCEVVAGNFEDSSSGVTVGGGHNSNITPVCFCKKAQYPKCAVVLHLSHIGGNVFCMHEGSPRTVCGEEGVAGDSSSIMVDLQEVSEPSSFQHTFDFESSEVHGSREAKTVNRVEQSVQTERSEVRVRDSKDTCMCDHYLDTTPGCVHRSRHREDDDHTGQSVSCVDEGSSNTEFGGERMVANSSSTVVSDVQNASGLSSSQHAFDFEPSEVYGSREEKETVNRVEQSVQTERSEVRVRDSKDTCMCDHYLDTTPGCVHRSRHREDDDHTGQSVSCVDEGSSNTEFGGERMVANSSSTVVSDVQNASGLSSSQHAFDFEPSEVYGSRETKTVNRVEQSMQTEHLEVGMRKDTRVCDHYLDVTPACVHGSCHREDDDHTGQSVSCVDEGSSNTEFGGERMVANSSSTVVLDVRNVSGSSSPQCVLGSHASEATAESRSANLNKMIALVALPLILKYILNALCRIFHVCHHDG